MNVHSFVHILGMMGGEVGRHSGARSLVVSGASNGAGLKVDRRAALLACKLVRMGRNALGIVHLPELFERPNARVELFGPFEGPLLLGLFDLEEQFSVDLDGVVGRCEHVWIGSNARV